MGDFKNMKNGYSQKMIEGLTSTCKIKNHSGFIGPLGISLESSAEISLLVIKSMKYFKHIVPVVEDIINIGLAILQLEQILMFLPLLFYTLFIKA